MGDELARTVIVEELAALDPVSRREVAKAVLDAVLELAPSGQLDERLLTEEQRKLLQTAQLLPKRAENLVTDRAHTILRPNGPLKPFDTLAISTISEVASSVLTKIAEHVQAQPFEGPRGRFAVGPTTPR